MRPGVGRAPVVDSGQEQPRIDPRRRTHNLVRVGSRRSNPRCTTRAEDPVQHRPAVDPSNNPSVGRAHRAGRCPKGPRDQLSPPPLPYHLRDRPGLNCGAGSRRRSPAFQLGSDESARCNDQPPAESTLETTVIGRLRAARPTRRRAAESGRQVAPLEHRGARHRRGATSVAIAVLPARA